MGDEAGGPVDLRQHVRLAQRRHPGQSSERSDAAHPQPRGLRRAERNERRSVTGSRRGRAEIAMGREQPMHRGAMQARPPVDDARTLEHPDDPPDGAPGPLALDAQDLLGDRRGDRAAPAPVLPIRRGRARGSPRGGRRRTTSRLCAPRDGRAAPSGRSWTRAAASAHNRAAVAVLEARTGQRPEHAEAPERDRLFVVVGHGPSL